MPAKIEIMQIKGVSGHTDHQRRVLRALGLTRREQKVIHEDTPQIKGMINKVAHLVKVTQK